MSKRQNPLRAKPSKGRAKHERVCLLVLGMHRSGTSALTRVMSLLGADLPATLLGGRRENLASNAKGHWESEPIVRLNDEIFDSAGISWRSPETMPDQWYQSVRFEQFRKQAQEVLESEFGHSPLFVLKDPRVCKLVPFWMSVIEDAEIKPAIVSMVRSPQEVADSLLQRNGLDRPLGILMWLRYALRSERDSRRKTRVYLSYEGLLADWQSSAQTVSDAFRIRWPSSSAERAERITGFLSESEWHHRRGVALDLRGDVGSWAAEAYGIFNQWVQNGQSAADYPNLDSIAQRLDETIQPLLASLLVSYEKSTTVQKLQSLRTSADRQIDDMKAQLRSLREQVSSLAKESEIPLPGTFDINSSDDVEAAAINLDGLALEIKAQREAARRELEDLSAQQERVNAELSLVKEELQSKKAELKREKHDFASREAKAHDLLNLERDQRLAVEAKLDQTQSVNATLLIIRGRFEAAIGDLVRLREEREAIQRRSKGDQRKLQDLESQFAHVQAQLEDVQKRSKYDREKLRGERDKVRAALAAVREDRALRLAERDNCIKELTRSVKRAEKKLEKSRQLQCDLKAETQASSTRQRAPVTQLLRSLLPGSQRQRLLKNIELVKDSGLFDAIYYLERYPDLQGDPSELLEHYVRYGGAEGRAPSAAFDGHEYRERYPDVAAKGLNPLIHFLKYGKAEGRTFNPVRTDMLAPFGDDEATSTSVSDNAEAGESKGTELFDSTLVKSPDLIASASAVDQENEELSSPAIEPLTVDSFSALAVGAADWRRSSELVEPTALVVGNIAVAVKNEPDNLHSSLALQWFDILNCSNPVNAPDDACNAVRRTLYEDRLIIEDAWLSSDFALRIRFCAHGSDPLVVRCCQPKDDGAVSLCTEQLLTAHGLIVIDITLASRFTPILLVVTDHQGRLIDSTLLPFPTLLRGGLHHGELIDYSRSSGGWAAHEEYASKLLIAFAAPSREFAVRDVSVALLNANGTEPVFSEAFRNWLHRQFNLDVKAKLGSTSDNLALLVLTEQIQAPAPTENAIRTAGRTLLIGENAIPSLGILLAKEADLANASAMRTIVVDELTRRPLRAVDYPVIDCGREALPQQAFEPALTPSPRQSHSTIVVSISFSTGDIHDVRSAFPASNDVLSAVSEMIAVEDTPISAIITCSGSVDALSELLASLVRQQSASALECLLIGTVPDVPDSILLPFDAGRPVTLVRPGGEGGTMLSRLHATVQQATHDRLLLVDDQKVLHDPRTLGVLNSLCALDEIGTAGCHIVTETENKKAIAEFRTRAAYLPLSRDRHSPALTRPDAGGLALPSVYPVLANPIGFLMTKREVWPFEAGNSDDTEEGRQQSAVCLGLAIISGGKLNIATSLVSVSEYGETSHIAIQAPLATLPPHLLMLEEY